MCCWAHPWKISKAIKMEYPISLAGNGILRQGCFPDSWRWVYLENKYQGLFFNFPAHGKCCSCSKAAAEVLPLICWQRVRFWRTIDHCMLGEFDNLIPPILPCMEDKGKPPNVYSKWDQGTQERCALVLLQEVFKNLNSNKMRIINVHRSYALRYRVSGTKGWPSIRVLRSVR